MSYDLYFTKHPAQDPEAFFKILESETTPANSHYLSKEFRQQIIETLESRGFVFEIFTNENNDSFDLTFPTYQVHLFSGEIAISVPYWDANKDPGIDSEIKQIANILLSFGLTGFDSQMEEFITDQFEFGESFSESKKPVDDYFKKQPGAPHYSLIGIVAVTIIIGIVILWRVLKQE